MGSKRGAGPKGVTLETLAGQGAALNGHFQLVFAAAMTCLALAWVLFFIMEERPLRTSAAQEQAPAPAE